jgi:hypothetical protein
MRHPWGRPLRTAEVWRRHSAGAFFLCCVSGTGCLHAENLPAGLSRFNPAGLSTDWRYEGIAFEELGAPASDIPTVPILRLHHPRNGYLLTASESEAAAAEAKGFKREGVAFLAPAKSSKPVLRFRIPKNGGYFFTTSNVEGTKAGFTPEGVAFFAYEGPAVRTSLSAAVPVGRYLNETSGLYLFTSGHESPYEVGAYYFGSFTQSAKEIIAGTQRVYGRSDDWWGGVKDFYGAEPGVSKDHRGWPGEWPDLKPAIGYYDQSLPTTLEQHINEAADAGLTFFSFYWYWSNAKHGELYPEAIASFLRARNVDRLKFNLTLYAHPWDDDMVVNSGNIEEVVQMLVRYFGSPHYLRLPDGRPVFAIGDDRNVRASDGHKCTDTACNEQALSAFLGVLKDRTIAKLGYPPFIQIHAGAPGWDKQPGVDGVTCLAPPGKIAGGTPYPEMTAETFAQLVRAGKPVSPCMFENFDDRPRQDILIPDRSKIFYLVGKTDALFRHNLMAAKDVSDQNYVATKSAASHIIYIYAWNEWHEGGILEPTVAGAENLNIVTDVFQLPRLPSRCLDHGDCKIH